MESPADIDAIKIITKQETLRSIPYDNHGTDKLLLINIGL